MSHGDDVDPRVSEPPPEVEVVVEHESGLGRSTQRSEDSARTGDGREPQGVRPQDERAGTTPNLSRAAQVGTGETYGDGLREGPDQPLEPRSPTSEVVPSEDDEAQVDEVQDDEVQDGELVDYDALVEQVALEIRQRSTSFSGPLPEAGDMKRYQEMIPDAPERFLRVVESGTSDNSKRFDKLVEAEISEAIAGRKTVTWMFFVCVGFSALFFAFDHLVAGSVFISIPVLRFLSGFVSGTKSSGSGLSLPRRSAQHDDE